MADGLKRFSLASVCILAVVGSPRSARSDVVCITTSGNPRPVVVRRGGACRKKEVTLGSFDAFKSLLAATSSAPGGGGVQLTGNIQIASPVKGAATAAAQTATALAPAAASGDSNHFCVGGGFPGQ